MKQIYIFSLLSILFLYNIGAQTLFDWESTNGTTDNGTSITQTVNGITATFTVSSNNPFYASGGLGNTTGRSVAADDSNTDSWVNIAFSQAINISSLIAYDGDSFADSATWTFTPTGGTNSVVNQVMPDAGTTVTLNWTGVTNIRVTSDFAGGLDWFVLDNISSDFTLSSPELEFKDSQVKLFPNPTIDYIQFKNITKAEKYVIYNIIGKEISNGTINVDGEIDVQSYVNGLYFLKRENGGTIKFIKE
ncbi:T9SS type A sorting domain-containing protein [Sabulilitoribacter arenilitoris]|uniref:T9SS type A sorting domain-containing protein n=1 Tax=Wocania arenilitoris TaxID=2044858 RepID=A0AAE3JMG2_9FLAO|nr:T9SS type A sorting domain-containing protein [Wocania arenilitoris]MCF7569304.1 T9SS type A sorting domain-containing protein [Wocania arenilitoris]